MESSNAGVAVLGGLYLVILVVTWIIGMIVAVVWIALPFMLNKHLKAIRAQLDSIQYLLTKQDRRGSSDTTTE